MSDQPKKLAKELLAKRKERLEQGQGRPFNLKSVTYPVPFEVDEAGLLFIESLYSGLGISPVDAVERFNIACLENMMIPEQVMKALKNEFPSMGNQL